MSCIDVDGIENELQIKEVLFAMRPRHVLYEDIQIRVSSVQPR